MNRPLLIVGENGQLSRALQKRLTARARPFKVIGSAHVDLAMQPEIISAIIDGGEYGGVINCSAFTDVDGAETQITAAQNLNTHAPALMAESCARQNLPFLHISTDYVFNGEAAAPYKPSDPPNPINVYGRTKADGEALIMAAGGRSLILRTSWVYDARGKNFLTTMQRLGRERDVIDVVNDQVGRPTFAGHLALACLTALGDMPESPEIYHISNTGDPVSWAQFAREIFYQSGIICSVNGIPSAKYPTAALRPAFSVLSTQDYEARFAFKLPAWQDGLSEALRT